MRHALPEHFAVVGPAWLEFERAVQAAGAVGEDLNEQLASLRGRIAPATLDTAHQLRRQRNALFHDGTLIRDLRGWEAQCRRTIADLRALGGMRTRVGARVSDARSRSQGSLLPVALAIFIAAIAGLGVVGFAWFDMAAACSRLSDRLGCTFGAEYVTPALGVVAIVALAVVSRFLRRRPR